MFLNIRRALPSDYQSIFSLDLLITGENRKELLEKFLFGGWVYPANHNSNITGFFLPTLDRGPIIASDYKAGLNLLKFKLSLGHNNFGIPENNLIALNFLLDQGFQVQYTLPRMELGNNINWHQEGVFNIGSYFCG